mgnify:CR=1 FL=1
MNVGVEFEAAGVGGSNFDADNERSFELFRAIAVRHFETVADFDALSVIS